MLEIESIALCILDKYFSNELYPQSFFTFYFETGSQ